MRDMQRTVYIPSLVVFAAVMAVVMISFFMSRNSNEREIVAEMQAYEQKSEDAVRDRLIVFEETLRAGIGVLEGDDDVTRGEWARFIETSAVIKRYPGAAAVGYAPIVKAADLNAFSDETSTRYQRKFVVYPEGARSEYVPIVFIAPQEEYEPILGFDISTDATRRKALETARDSGQAAVSSPVQSPVDQLGSDQYFVMYMPQYELGLPIDTAEQRKKAIKGYVYVGFGISSFMGSVSSDESDSGRAFGISIGDTQDSTYATGGYDSIIAGRHRTAESEVSIGGAAITFNYVYDTGSILPAYMNSRSVAVLVFGTITALLVAGSVWLTLLGKSNQLLLEKERSINEAKDSLLSIASHQLRTPATGVKQYLGLLLQGFSGELTNQQRMLLEKAYASNERQLKTINEILYLARLDAGRIVLSKTHFSIASVVRDTVTELSDQIKTKGHVVRLKIPRREKPFYGDEHMIRMAVENLLTNAVKYTHQKGVISVRVTFGKDLKIVVEDNGIGIPEDQQQEMFNQFVRLDNDLSVAVGGTGIGLYVVQHILELHDGNIAVDSHIGKGSKFTISLPFSSPDNSG